MRNFESLLRMFPFSQRDGQPQTTVSVLAIDETEPPLLEYPMNGPFDVDDAISLMKEHRGDDIGYRVESYWDLWQYDGDWRVAPTAVTLSCFGPEFDNGTADAPGEQEHLRIDFGV